MKDELRWNKIFGGLLGAVLLLLIVRQGAEMLFAPTLVKTPGYAVAVATGEAGATAEVADTPPDWGTELAKADVAAGAAVSQKCASCHNFANGGPNQTGPNLWGVLGRKPGSHPGFAYSQGLTDFSGKQAAWDYQHVYEFLAGPAAYINGTKMSFVGLKKREDRINLIAWLRQQNGSPPPIPAPNPAAAAPAAAAPAADTAAPAAAPADAAKPADAKPAA
jgi:cytochrome c